MICPATLVHGDIQVQLLLGTMPGTMVLPQSRSVMSEAPGTIEGILMSGAMLVSEGYVATRAIMTLVVLSHGNMVSSRPGYHGGPCLDP